MLAHTALAAFPELHPRGGQGDEPLEKIGHPPTSAAGVPKPLPSLVRLPIIPTIQEVNAVQIGSALPIGVESYPGLRPGTANESKKKAMPGPVAGRMRVFATRVGVGGQRELGATETHYLGLEPKVLARYASELARTLAVPAADQEALLPFLLIPQPHDSDVIRKLGQ